MNNKNFSVRSVVIYLVVSVLMTLLTASFVLESVYHNSDSISMTPQGIKTVYESCIGILDFSHVVEPVQNTTVQSNTTTTTAEPAPSAAAQ